MPLLPPEPALSEPLPAPEPSAEALRRLALRRSVSAHTLGLPGPSPEQAEALLRLGARVPDHGKLAPWRFVVLEADAKVEYVRRLRDLAAGQPEPETAAKKLKKMAAAPFTVVVVSRPKPGKIPVWEQELSAGAVCMALLTAADALGFAGNWITDWYAYTPEAVALLGLEPGERVAGFIHVGTPAEPPLERERPRVETLVTRWSA